MGLIEDVHAKVGAAMNAVRAIFRPEVKITVLIRSSEHPDGSFDFVHTDDDLKLAAEALSRVAAKDQPPLIKG